MSEITAFDENTLKSIVREYMTIDDQIKTIRKALKERNDRKKELSTELMKFMKSNELQQMDTKTGKLIYAKSENKKPLTKDTLVQTLTKYFDGDPAKALECCEHIYSNRETYERERIKRTYKK